MKLCRRTLMAGVAISLVACGDDDVDIREGNNTGILADSAVVAQMRDTGTVNRIIYDPAPDLSLSSAQQRRPDIFRSPVAGALPRPASRDTAPSGSRARPTPRQ